MDTINFVSVVIPVYNEVQSLPLLADQLLEVMDSLTLKKWEVLFVDDGSMDGSTLKIQELCARHSVMRSVYLKKNFGKAAALQAGFEAAQGEAIVTIDSDLQDDPNEIPTLIAKLEEGYDVVSGWKKERNDPLEKRLASKLFNFVVSATSRIPLHDFNCGLKAYRAWALQGLTLRGNMHRYIPIFLGQRGASIAEIPVNHSKRTFGKSKYGFKRYLHGFCDLLTVIFLTKFYQNPLYFFGSVSVPFLLLGSCLGAYLLSSHTAFLFGAPWGEQLVARPLLIICVSMFGFGLQIMLTGLMCEFILRLKDNGKAYWVRQTSPWKNNAVLPVEQYTVVNKQSFSPLCSKRKV